MKRICAWCDKDMGEKEGEERSITHGMCEDCAAELRATLPGNFSRFLDGLGMPVLMVNCEGTVTGANEHAREVLGKQLPQIQGLRSGDVMHCEHASLPEGCGNTVHCAACGVRNSVMETFENGNSLKGVQTYIDRATPDGARRMWLCISTEKIGEIVLLRIDEARIEENLGERRIVCK